MMNLLIWRFAETIKNCPAGNTDPTCQTTLPQVSANQSTISTTLQYLFGALGGLTLIYLAIMGLRYVLSQGNPQELSKNRDGIVYAVVGLTICVSAEIIVTFVLNKL